MRIGRLFVSIALLAIVAASPTRAFAAHHDTSHTQLSELLDWFLAGASRGDAAVHERFWDDALVYTSSAGERTNKQTILESMQGREPTDSPDIVYTADQVDIRVYDDIAIVAFRLVATSRTADDQSPTLYYLNTGTFQKQNNEWRAIAWQATRAAE